MDKDFELYDEYLNELDYRIKKISDDEYWLLIEGNVFDRYINCKNVSEAFLLECIIWDIVFILEEGLEEDHEKETDMEELLDDWIKEGLWDWKKEVKERNAHGEIVFNIEELIEKGRKKRYE